MADDEYYLSPEDLAGIFGTEVGGASGDLARDIADLFVDEDAPVDELASAPAEEAEPQEPPRQEGVSEADWRASAEYEDFRSQVIARHLAKKQAEEAEAARVSEEDQVAAVERARLEQERRKAEALERQAGQGPGVAPPVAARIIPGAGAKSPQASKAASIPPAPPVPSRTLPPAPPVPQRMAAAAAADDTRLGKPLAASEDQKEERFRAYLKDLKVKMAKGDLELRSRSAVPKTGTEGEAIQLGIDAAKTVAAMFEGLRIELIRNVTDVVGRKAAQAVMKKTLAKALKAHHEVFGRAGMDARGELKLDGQLDEEKLARSIYGLPPDTRLVRTCKAFHDLNEMRLIALELGLGHRAKAKATSNALNSLEANFNRKGYPPVLIKWFFDEAIPSTSLAEGDSDRF